MEVQIDFTLLVLVEKLGVDKIKAINEGLTLWLKEELTTFPITNNSPKSNI